MRGTTSTNEIRTAIRELSARAELAHKDRVDGYPDELSHRP
jgi:hypothetical protein